MPGVHSQSPYAGFKQSRGESASIDFGRLHDETSYVDFAGRPGGPVEQRMASLRLIIHTGLLRALTHDVTAPEEVQRGQEK